MSASVRFGALYAVLALAVAMAVPVNAQQVSSPVITGVLPDFTAGVLRIEGTGFPTSPQIFFNSVPLMVLAESRSEIVTDLPVGIDPGSYRLVVTSSGKNPPTATFAVALGQLAPKGLRVRTVYRESRDRPVRRGHRGRPDPPALAAHSMALVNSRRREL